jgi:hypothetical protein
MKIDRQEIVRLYFGENRRLPTDLWLLILEISGLVKFMKGCVFWEIHIPRFIFSKDLDKAWLRRRNQPG